MTALRLKEQKMEQYRRTAELERSERVISINGLYSNLN